MSYTVKKSEPCKGCNEPTFRRERNTRDALCLDCSAAKAKAQWQQLAQHSGPHYDAWLNSMSKFLRRQGTGTPPSYTKQDSASRDALSRHRSPILAVVRCG